MCGNCLREPDPQEHTIESFQSPVTSSMGIRVFLASVSQWVVIHNGLHIVYLFSLLQQLATHVTVIKSCFDVLFFFFLNQ